MTGLVPSLKSDRNKDRKVKVTVYPDMVQCELGGEPEWLPGDEQRTRGGTRKAITKFSKSSRNNLLRNLAMVENVGDGLFVTLTYPDQFPASPEIWKRDLATLRKRIARAMPSVGGLWRMERKRRKSGKNKGWLAPHFHILIVGFDRGPEVFRRWIRIVWYAIAHRGDVHQGRAAVQVDRIHSRKHAIYYVSKYMGKGEDDEPSEELNEPEFVGRYWGTFGAWEKSVLFSTYITIEELIRLKRLFRSFLRRQNRRYARKLAGYQPWQGVSVFRLGYQSMGAEPLSHQTVIRMLASL